MWVTLAVLVACAAVPVRAGGDPPAGDCLERSIAAVQRRYESIRDFRARFEQTTRSASLGSMGGGTATSRGTVAFAKPGKMRWSYEEPDPSLVVSDGETLWLYDPAAREVQKLRVGAAYLSGAAIQFLLGEGDMRRDFRVTLLACADDAVALDLQPREDAAYERLRVHIDPATGDLTRTEIVDLFGNVTEVAFSGMRANLDPPAETFRFDVPDGVRVIEIGGAP
jgi:outer membrane lipoprotein carrier protein